MDLGANFSSKLEPFLLMAKSVKGAAAAKLIQDATAAPGVFVFGELLELPNIQELAKSDQHSKFYSLLELFACKTYQDYLQHKDALPPLNPAQITKLKHLSIASLASERRILPYAELLKALDVTTVRELEDLIIDAIYLDILQGKVDQKEEQLEVEYTMGRDVNVQAGGLEDILKALSNWASTTASVLHSLDAKLESIASAAAHRQLRQQEHEKELQTTLKEVSEKKDHKGGRRLADRESRDPDYRQYGMDIDEPAGLHGQEPRGKNRKASQESMTTKPLRKRNKF